MTDLQKFGLKFFLRNPEAVRPREVVPVFHRWIQTRGVEGLLIDVADYSHLANGPGVTLVGHEGDYYLDSMEGPLGLLYLRKAPLPGRLEERLRAGLRTALTACAKLEGEPEFEGALRFKGGEVLFLSNDRLAGPNTEEAFAALKPDLSAAFSKLYGGPVELRRDASDPRRRLSVTVAGDPAADVAALLSRLG
jgi:hypothetical protein